MFIANKIFKFRNVCSKIMQNTIRCVFVSMNEKMIEIWTYILINKQSICSITLSKQMQSKTMWIIFVEIQRFDFEKTNACIIETCDFVCYWFRQNHNINFFKHNFIFISFADDSILLIKKFESNKSNNQTLSSSSRAKFNAKKRFFKFVTIISNECYFWFDWCDHVIIIHCFEKRSINHILNNLILLLLRKSWKSMQKKDFSNSYDYFNYNAKRMQ